MAEINAKNIGLRGVTVADSKVSMVDGVNGRLIYRGYKITDLAQEASFEEVVYLLLMGRLPTADELKATVDFMRQNRPLPPEVVGMLELRDKKADTMDVLQSAIAALSDADPDLNGTERKDRVQSALRLIARTASVLATWYHIRQGEPAPTIDTEGSHAEAFLKALWKKQPSEQEAKLVDVLLVLHAEHTFNASTFAVREVASTRARLYPSVAAGVGALSGPLHGGANSRVMQMLREIGQLENVEPWIRKRIEANQRVMGLGHAVYKTEDPRAQILRKVAESTLKGTRDQRWFDLALRVDEVSRRLLQEIKGIALYPNVDFYSGGVLNALGLPDELFPAFFAVSRVSGWCAHYIEEELAEAQPKAALYRPRANYTGRSCGPQGCQFIPIEDRGAGCPCGDPLNSCEEELAAKAI